jgi:hypothetical protein
MPSPRRPGRAPPRTLWQAPGREMRVGELSESLEWEKSRAAQSAVLVHAGNIRRCFLDSLTPEQAVAIRPWSEQMIDRIEPRHSETTCDDAA